MDVREKLLTYLKAKQYVDACADLLDQARADALKSPNMDGMPRTPGVHGLDTVMARIDALERKLIRAKKKATKVCNEVINLIHSLDDYDQRAVLIFHYIAGLPWDEVAFKVNYSRRKVLYIHKDALRELRKKNP